IKDGLSFFIIFSNERMEQTAMEEKAKELKRQRRREYRKRKAQRDAEDKAFLKEHLLDILALRARREHLARLTPEQKVTRHNLDRTIAQIEGLAFKGLLKNVILEIHEVTPPSSNR